MKNLFYLFLTLIFLSSCSTLPKVQSNMVSSKFQALGPDEKVYLVEEIPVNAFKLGDVRVGDGGLTKICDKYTMINVAKEKAKSVGANAIFITKISPPNGLTTCYRVEAQMLRIEDPKMLADLEVKELEENKPRLPKSADYAKVYFYRPSNFQGGFIGYKIRMKDLNHDDDTVIGTMGSGDYFEITLTEFGEYNFWAATEARADLYINVEKGKEYFVRCGLTMGVMVGHPTLHEVEVRSGISEYDEMKK